jgi:hypothetical protein
MLLCISLGTFSVFGQLVKPQVIASAGGTATNDSLNIDWTIGEVVIHTHESNNVLLTQGFHQPYLTTTSLHSLPEYFGSIVAFPNPVSGIITVQLKFDQNHHVLIELHDLGGKQLWTTIVQTAEWQDSVDLSNFAAGFYYLLFTIDHTYTHTLKIQKLP